MVSLGNLMIELIFHIAVLITSAALIVFLLRQKGSYFRSVQILFVIGFLSFAGLALFDLIKNFLVRSAWVVLYTTIGGVSAAIITAIVVEQAALTLYKEKREKASSKSFFREKLNILSVTYKGYATSVLIVTWVFAPWQTRLVMDFWGNSIYNPVYEFWYLVSLAIVLVAFVAYPCTLFYLASREYREERVVSSLRWLGLCWAGIGVTLIMYHGYLRSLEIETVSIGYLFHLFFFSIIAYFFKTTNILEGFFERQYPSIPVRGGKSFFFAYTPKADKTKLFSTLILKGLTSGHRVIYKYPDNENEVVRRKLKEHGVDVERCEENESLILTTLSQFYLSDGIFDGEKAVRFLNKLKEDTLQKGYTKLMDFVDLGDFSFLGEDKERYIEYLNDERWKTYVDNYVIELFAANAEKVDEKLLHELTNVHMHTPIRLWSSIDLIAHADVFSEALGLTRQQMTGRIILFEFDPSSDYKKPIGDFATEALTNAEPVALFTHKGSVIHSALNKREGIKILLLTQRVSAPKVNSSTNEMLLPVNNTPLLLDALERMLKTSSYGGLNIVFDSLSSLILFVGFEKTCKFVRYALDMLASEKSTALFLFSPDTHDQRVVSGLRSLFSNHLRYAEDSLQIVKLSEFKLKA
jgi:hypothetical protein